MGLLIAQLFPTGVFSQTLLSMTVLYLSQATRTLGTAAMSNSSQSSGDREQVADKAIMLSKAPSRRLDARWQRWKMLVHESLQPV
jgi:hypothetical protein